MSTATRSTKISLRPVAASVANARLMALAKCSAASSPFHNGRLASSATLMATHEILIHICACGAACQSAATHSNAATHKRAAAIVTSSRLRIIHSPT